jgi:hypothetical protein
VPAAINHWSALADRARRLFGDGLGDRTENLELVLLVPKAWGPSFYDPLRQELIRPVLDDQNRIVNLWLPFTPENEKAVAWLDRHDPSATYGLLGSLRLVAGRLCVQPISLYVEDKTVHLTLLEPEGAAPAKPPPQEAAANEPPGSEEELLAGDDDPVPEAAPATPLGRILTTAQAEVESLVEAGLAVRRNLDLLQGAAKRLETLSLTACSRPLSGLAEAIANSTRLADPRFRDQAAGRLLHAYYVLRLAADQETIESACTGLR